MIPTIETIVEDLAAGNISKAQAIAWLYQHAEDAGRCLRDDFAAAALSGLNANGDLSAHCSAMGHNPAKVRTDYATTAYQQADVMLKERNKLLDKVKE